MPTELETKLYEALKVAAKEAAGWCDDSIGQELPAEIRQVFEDAFAEYEQRPAEKMEDESPPPRATQEQMNAWARHMVDLVASQSPKAHK